MAERRDWVPLALVAGLAVLAVLVFFPSSSASSAYSVLSSRIIAPDGGAALYRTMERLGIPVARREAPLADAGPVPANLAILAPEQALTTREVGNVLARVRRGGTLLWVRGMRTPLTDYLSDSLGLRTVYLPTDARVSPRKHAWTEGIGVAHKFRYAFAAMSVPTEATPLLAATDSFVVAFTERLGSGTVVAVSDPAPLVNANIAAGGIAPLMVRAAAAATSSGGPLVFDEFHHGFHGGSVRSGIAHFLTRRPLGHVVTQWMAVGLLALLLVSARLGAPHERTRRARRSPLEHVDALGQLYREAGAVGVPRRLLLGGLARTLGEPIPRDDTEAQTLLRRVEERGGDPGVAARALREHLEGGEADVLAVARHIDRIREEINR